MGTASATERPNAFFPGLTGRHMWLTCHAFGRWALEVRRETCRNDFTRSSLVKTTATWLRITMITHAINVAKSHLELCLAKSAKHVTTPRTNAARSQPSPAHTSGAPSCHR